MTSQAGTKLDRETVEELAAEAERGYDLATAMSERIGSADHVRPADPNRDS